MCTLNRDNCFYRSRATQKMINGVLMAYRGRKGSRACVKCSTRDRTSPRSMRNTVFVRDPYPAYCSLAWLRTPCRQTNNFPNVSADRRKDWLCLRSRRVPRWKHSTRLGLPVALLVELERVMENGSMSNIFPQSPNTYYTACCGKLCLSGITQYN